MAYQDQRQGNGGGLAGYIDVAERVNAFWREMRATKTPARIETEILDVNERSITVKASVYIHFESVGWVKVADGLAEDMRATAPKGKCLEVAQTSAVGRALALAGYASSTKIASRDEMESYYAAQEAEARENGAAPAVVVAEVEPVPPAEQVKPTPIKRPKPTKAEVAEVFDDQAGIAQKAKVGVATEHASGEGETVEQAVGEAFGKAAKQAATERAAATGEAARVFPNDKAEAARLAKMPPPFRAFIEKMHGYAEQGETFEQIRARFGAAKPRMGEPEVKEARHQLAILKTRCEEIAAAAVDPALAEDVATELDALTEEERAFMAS